jgi:recombination protein RecA
MPRPPKDKAGTKETKMSRALRAAAAGGVADAPKAKDKKKPPPARTPDPVLEDAEVPAADIVKAKPPQKGGKLKTAVAKLSSSFRRSSTVRRAKHWSTGNFALDLALGGGLLKGRFHQFWGTPSGGKTEKVLRTIAAIQQTCRHCMAPVHSCDCGDCVPAECAYVQTEGDWDDIWARRLGVNTDELLLGLPEAGDAILDEIVDMVRLRQIDVVVIDSLAFMTTTKEVAAAVTRESVGEQARMFGKAFRKLMSIVVQQQAAAALDPKTRIATIITTNQIRFKVGVMFGNPETVGGGEAPKFANSTETRCSKVKILETAAHGAVACTAVFKVSKNKTYRPHQKAEYTFALYPHDGYRTGQLMDEKAVVKAAMQVGQCYKNPSGTGFIFFGERFGTAAQIGERLAADPPFKWKATQAIIQAVTEGDALVEMEVTSDGEEEDGDDDNDGRVTAKPAVKSAASEED